MKKIPCLFLKDPRSQTVTPTLAPGMEWVYDEGVRFTWDINTYGYPLFEALSGKNNGNEIWSFLRSLVCSRPDREGIIIRGPAGQIARLRRVDYGYSFEESGSRLEEPSGGDRD